MKKYLDKRILGAVIGGVIIGVLLLVSVLYARYQNKSVHYHANFAMYVNGQREKFDSFTFYEEIQACSDEVDNNPKHRVHMHEQVSDLIHVHAPAVTWGHFFANLGYSVGDSSLETDSGSFTESKDKKLVFIVNSQKVDSIANRLIGADDKLLIDFGDSSNEELDQRYKDITNSAVEANTKNDPATCRGSEELKPINRIKRVLNL